MVEEAAPQDGATARGKTGQADGSNDRPPARRLFRRGLSYMRPEAGLTAFGVTLALVAAAFGALEPLVMKFIFDRLTAGAAVDALLIGVGLLLGLHILREAVQAVSNWVSWRVRLRVHHRMLGVIVERLHSLPMSYHREESVGGLMTRLERGVNTYVGALNQFAFQTVPSLAFLVLAVVLMLSLDVRLTILVLFFAPLPALIAHWASYEQIRRERSLLDRWTRIYSRFNEVLTGIVTIKSFAMEDREKNRFLGRVGDANEVVERGVLRDSTIGAFHNIVITIARIAAIGLGGLLILRGEVTIGTLIAFLAYIGALFGPVQGLTGTYQTVRRATVSLESIFEILDAQDRLGDAPDAKAVGRLQGRVRFDHVRFAYEGVRPVLHDIDFEARPGESIAIVGPSGSGKSTLMSLLQRLYDPTDGRILVDGMDLRKIKQRSLRLNIGVVHQDPTLFNDTARDVIAYARPEAPIEEVIEVAKAAQIHDVIMELPKGYDTLVGERGNRLSLGERQRVAIARALLKDPSMVIFDEATSALDAETEALVQKALDRLTQGRTTFIVAHRLATVVGADRILVLRDGHIIEQGSHAELMEKDGYYARLVRHQTQGLLPPDA